MKAYGNTDIDGFEFTLNAIYGCPEAGIFFHQDNYSSDGITISSNYTWLGYLRLGYPLGNGGHSNAIFGYNYIVDNHAAAPLYVADGWRNIWFTNNTVMNMTERYVWSLERFGETSGDLTSHHIDFNTYYSTNYGIYGSGQFATNESNLTFDAWRGTVRGDTNSTVSYIWPSDNVVSVFQPSEDSNFLHVVVYNWASNSTLSTNIGSWFSSGDSLQIFDAQEIPISYTNFTYSGGEVSLDLTRTNIATMNGGKFADRAESWTGFDPRFRTFVIYRTGSGGEDPSAADVVRIYSN
jgi:hypothetical protein